MASVARVGVRGTREWRAWLVWESVGLVIVERGSCGSPWDSWMTSVARVGVRGTRECRAWLEWKLRTENRHKLTRRQPTPRARWVTLSCRLSTLAAGPATAGDVASVGCGPMGTRPSPLETPWSWVGARAAGWRRGRDLPGIGSMPAVALKQSLWFSHTYPNTHRLVSMLKGFLFSAAALLLLSPEVCARLWPLCPGVVVPLSPYLRRNCWPAVLWSCRAVAPRCLRRRAVPPPSPLPGRRRLTGNRRPFPAAQNVSYLQR